MAIFGIPIDEFFKGFEKFLKFIYESGYGIWIILAIIVLFAILLLK